jgi:hypothetical protein
MDRYKCRFFKTEKVDALMNMFKCTMFNKGVTGEECEDCTSGREKYVDKDMDSQERRIRIRRDKGRI